MEAHPPTPPSPPPPERKPDNQAALCWQECLQIQKNVSSEISFRGDMTAAACGGSWKIEKFLTCVTGTALVENSPPAPSQSLSELLRASQSFSGPLRASQSLSELLELPPESTKSLNIRCQAQSLANRMISVQLTSHNCVHSAALQCSNLTQDLHKSWLPGLCLRSVLQERTLCTWKWIRATPGGGTSCLPACHGAVDEGTAPGLSVTVQSLWCLFLSTQNRSDCCSFSKSALGFHGYCSVVTSKCVSVL